VTELQQKQRNTTLVMTCPLIITGVVFEKVRCAKKINSKGEKGMKKITSLVLCLVMIFSLVVGCSQGNKDAATGTDEGTSSSKETGSPRIKDTLVIGSAAEINNLDLLAQNDQINNICLKLTHETLIFFTNDGKLEPELAESWEYVDDTTLEIKLKENVKFHDGTPMTAEDVKFTYEMCLNSNASTLMAGLKSVDVIDDYTVRLNLESYDNEFLMNLTAVNVGIQSKKAYESGMDEPYLVGTGQYKFEEWVSGEYVSFVRNENYWDPENAGVAERIIFRPIIEASARTIALQNGEIDVCIDPPINELQFLEKDDNIVVHEQPGTRLFYFAFNTTKEPWNNKTLRQAVAHAINRDDVLTVAVDGKGTPQTTILNRGLWGFYDEMEGFPYDLEKAKAKMAEAGYPDGGISTKLLIANSTPYTDIATVIQDNLKQIGIDVIIDVVEDATLKEICTKGEQELFLWRWNEDQKVDWVYNDLFATGSPYNYHHYSNPVADDLIYKVRTERDQEQRYQYGVELQELLVDDCAQVPLYIANLVIAYNKGLRGQYLFGGGNHDWSRAYIELQ
jgi:peptide/nickel transport system substrate-binding protein